MLKTLSVSELSHYVTSIFEAEELLQNIKVYGEVSGVSFVRGNLYFNLKDEGALMPCIMFGATQNSLKEGDQILAVGSMKYYAKGGKLNFYVSSVAPYGSGILYQKFVELKNKLEREGIFDSKHKKELPKEIKTIGVITSKTGAVLHDIQTVSHRRNPCLNIIVYPAKVQGDNAEKTIINGLRVLDKIKEVDVIIIARGGGSIEDFQPFNTESLAYEIIKTKKPVISAVGHETDFTICDFASSIRAATPSVGAELVASDMYEKIGKIKNNLEKISFLVFHMFDLKQEKLDKLKDYLTNTIVQKYTNGYYKLSQGISLLKNLSETFLIKKEKTLEINHNKLLLLNPINQLDRGWVRLVKNNQKICSITNVTKKDNLIVEMKDGLLNVIVENVKEKR